MNKNIIITGDIHNDFSSLNTLINKKKPKIIICCGDFGFWPNIELCQKLNDIKTQGTKILWCDGNHDDHWSLRDRTIDELAPNIFYMPRGSIYKLDDGRNIMFMGGAYSIDEKLRKIGFNWFPEEIIQQKDMYNLPDIKVDICITHTCPTELLYNFKPLIEKSLDPSNIALSELWKIYKPNLWFFGHWHTYKEGILNDTKWHCLSHPDQGDQWWMYLPY